MSSFWKASPTTTPLLGLHPAFLYLSPRSLLTTLHYPYVKDVVHLTNLSIRHITSTSPTTISSHCSPCRSQEAFRRVPSGACVDAATFPPRRLLVSLPHHGEWRDPARAVRRGAAHGSGGRDAFSASRSEGPDWLAERVTRREGDPSEGRPISEGHPSEGDPSEEIFRREG